jgi:transcriptional regulator with XRE-family HTH domain
MKRNTGRRQWAAASSGVQMQKFRKRRKLELADVADKLGVHVRVIEAIENGEEPQQWMIAQLDELYKMDHLDWEALYPPTDAELDRRRDYDERRAELSRKAAALDETWQPVRFRK